ncbi:unnamed protein product [Brassica oleracea]
MKFIYFSEVFVSNNHPLQPYFFKLSVRLRHRRPLEEKEEAREGKGDGGEERRRKADRLVSGMAIQNRVNGGRDTIRRKHPGGSHTPLSIISAIFHPYLEALSGNWNCLHHKTMDCLGSIDKSH